MCWFVSLWSCSWSTLCEWDMLFVDLLFLALPLTLNARCRVPFCLALPSSLVLLLVVILLTLLCVLLLTTLVGDFKLLLRYWLLLRCFLLAVISSVALFAWLLLLQLAVLPFVFILLCERLFETSTFSTCPSIYAICIISTSFCFLPLSIALPDAVRLCALLSFTFL